MLKRFLHYPSKRVIQYFLKLNLIYSASTFQASSTSVPMHSSTAHYWQKNDHGRIQSKQVTIILWNVNGYRSVRKKNELSGLFKKYKQEADFICLNQTKIGLEAYQNQMRRNNLKVQQSQGYKQYWNFCKVSNGYSGVMTFSKHSPKQIIEDMPSFQNHSMEGRIMTLQFQKFYLVNLYKPNSGNGLPRLSYRMQYQDCLRQFIKNLQEKKPVIIASDMNVVNQQIDQKNPKQNDRKPCFTMEQKIKFRSLLMQCNLVDSFRQLNPNTSKYSAWFSNFARANNSGWRIDYILVDKRIKISYAQILNDVYGSDHCPVIAKVHIG